MRKDYDLVIAGGGMVGVSLALALAERLPSERRVLLIEGFPLPAQSPDFARDYSPSFDARTTALSRGSWLIYEQLGLAERLLARACAITSIHVSERGRFGSTLMHAADYGWPALGYVIENAWLGNVLIQCLHRRSRVELLSPARVAGAVPDRDGIALQLDSGEVLRTGLLAVADGAASGLRSALGIDAAQRPYQQSAVIANVAHAGDHGGRAFERFTDQGPLACLPLPPRSLPMCQAEKANKVLSNN